MKKLPETIDQAVDELLRVLPKDNTAEITAMSKDDLIALHFGLGMWIRNNLGLWGGNRKLLQATGKEHPDDASGVIIDALWQRLQGQ